MNKLNITAPPGSHEITLSREFDAPRELVFKTMTDPKAVPHFWGPRSLTTTVDKMDARSGGSWRFIQKDPNGEEYGFHGVYHDVTPSERIIQTFEWEGLPGHALLETLRFEDLGGGRSRIVGNSVFQSVEDRDGMIGSGMESGATELYDRLEELVTKARV
jgi:uncharacterized protein YndB with AHSA1/START domain